MMYVVQFNTMYSYAYNINMSTYMTLHVCSINMRKKKMVSLQLALSKIQEPTITTKANTRFNKEAQKTN